MKYMKRSGVTLEKWAPSLDRWDYLLQSWGECSVVLGAMQRVRVRDKVITWITLFHSDRGYDLNFMNIISIQWISTLHRYYPHFVHIIHITWISWIFPHFVDIICIGHITSYLACNIHPKFHIYSSSERGWCIIYFTVCNLICFSVPNFFALLVL